MSDMLMDYFVITSGDEYSDIESENSDDHAISSDKSKSNHRARPRPVDDALPSRPTTSHQDQDIHNESAVTKATRPCGGVIL